jgi:hypothetical protein
LGRISPLGIAGAGLVLLACVLVADAVAQPVDLVDPSWPVWTERSSRAFPYVHLYTCRNQLVRFFPNTVDRLEREIEAASTLWFIEGGAHVRLYYRGTLPANDPACADVPTFYPLRPVGTPPPGPQPPFSSVVITAAASQRTRALPGFSCDVVRTDLWTTTPTPPFGSRAITRARIVLAAGDSCGSNQPYPWPETLQVPAYDYWTALMWALGRTLGLPDEPKQPSVRRPPQAGVLSRHLTNSDGQALRETYGPARSRAYWATSTDGITWRDWGLTPLFRNPSLGLSACALAGPLPGRPSSRFLVASTDAVGPLNAVTVVVADESLATRLSAQSFNTNYPPRVACGDSSLLVAFIDLGGELQVRRSTNGLIWSPVVMPALTETVMPPAIEFAPWKGWYLMVLAKQPSGLTYLISKDDGASFQVARDDDLLTADMSPIAFCAESLARCGVFHPRTPAAFLQTYEAFDTNGLVSGGSALLGWYRELFGGQVARSGPTPQHLLAAYANLRTTPPFNSTVKYPAGRVLSTTFGASPNGLWPMIRLEDRDTRLLSDSVPALARDPVLNRWVLLGTYLRAYNYDFVLTAPRPRPR